MREGKNMQIALLIDFYEPLLTEKQSEILRKYYDMDYSLAELAEESGISKQAVQFTLKQAERKLTEYEEALKLSARYEATKRLIDAYDAKEDIDKAITGLKKAWED